MISILRICWISIVLVFFLASCGGPRPLAGDPPPDTTPADVEVRNLDTLVVRPPKEDPSPAEELFTRSTYRAAEELDWDLLDTKLDLRFDWENETVIGNAILTMAPYFAPVEKIVLDAQGFNIGEVTYLQTGQKLDYTYDSMQLTVSLDRPYHRNEQIQIEIAYQAHPSEGSHGSAAISSDKGLFFINPRREEGNKPQQIWTQGETEFNSRWFPTFDQPNERCTQEVTLTVQDRFTTLSNGALVSSKSNDDGTRTDRWVLDKPHAPYLFMVAVGEFAVVKDHWKDREVNYYVEPEYEKDARNIFAHTPEMLTFFSELTGMEYPWNKYSQVVVRDYVSGAMENTTAVIYGEFVQKDSRSLIDDDNDYIVAHELFHHWFGDYVTCESWANLTLNEGFANYAEYLWFEYKYGKDRASSHRLQEIEGYLFQTQDDIHPLIDYAYADAGDMFDQHSYNKGGLVLHMLRHYVGDEAFFASLNHYLRKHALTAVEVDELRMAFEDVTGEDLNWFFDQWYLGAGHPIINMDYEWVNTRNELLVRVEQIQDTERHVPVFKIPTELGLFYADGRKEVLPIELDQRSQEVSIILAEAPSLVVLDPDRIQLALINCEYGLEDYRRMYDFDASLQLRMEALSKIITSDESVDGKIVEQALNDPFWMVRNQALNAIDWDQRPDLEDKLLDLAGHDPHSTVRSEAILVLGSLENVDHVEHVSRGINNHDAYPIVAASIRALYQIDPDLCEDHIGVLASDDHPEIVAALSSIYGLSQDTSYLPYFSQHMSTVSGLPALDFYQSLEILLSSLDPSIQSSWMSKSKDVAIDQKVSPYTRIAATRMIISQHRQARRDSETAQQLQSYIDEIMEKETNSQVKSIYRNFLDS